MDPGAELLGGPLRILSMESEKDIEAVARLIFVVRGQKVMLAADLARLYEVSTSNLNKSVGRNRSRFPDDFMFRLTPNEAASLTFQIGMSKTEGRGGRRHLPYAFTEQGVAMLAGVLRSHRAIQVNIAVMRAFVRFRSVLAAHKDLARRLNDVERRLAKKDDEITELFEAIRALMEPPPASKGEIGFKPSRAQCSR